MKVQDAFRIGRALGRIERALDAWEESKHPRSENGQFSSGGGGGGSSGQSGTSSAQGKADAFVKKYNLSEEEKSDLRKGLKRVMRGKWSEGDFENQIRGIAKSKERS